jgi:hypothetical protein
LIEEIEVVFLIVGHTHNALDQWFGTLKKRKMNLGWYIWTPEGVHSFLKSLKGDTKPLIVRFIDVSTLSWLTSINISSYITDHLRREGILDEN